MGNIGTHVSKKGGVGYEYLECKVPMLVFGEGDGTRYEYENILGICDLMLSFATPPMVKFYVWLH